MTRIKTPAINIRKGNSTVNAPAFRKMSRTAFCAIVARGDGFALIPLDTAGIIDVVMIHPRDNNCGGILHSKTLVDAIGAGYHHLTPRKDGGFDIATEKVSQ